METPTPVAACASTRHSEGAKSQMDDDRGQSFKFQWAWGACQSSGREAWVEQGNEFAALGERHHRNCLRNRLWGGSWEHASAGGHLGSSSAHRRGNGAPNLWRIFFVGALRRSNWRFPLLRSTPFSCSTPANHITLRIELRWFEPVPNAPAAELLLFSCFCKDFLQAFGLLAQCPPIFFGECGGPAIPWHWPSVPWQRWPSSIFFVWL